VLEVLVLPVTVMVKDRLLQLLLFKLVPMLVMTQLLMKKKLLSILATPLLFRLFTHLVAALVLSVSLFLLMVIC